jgi:DNA-binding transcriptional regulator LsrR (DeoR family)
MVKKVVVAAGGWFKVNALFTLLSLPAPIIHELCTDDRTAQVLLTRRERING